MLDNTLLDTINSSIKNIKGAKTMLESLKKQEKIVRSVVNKNKGKYSDSDISKVDSELKRVKELQKELDELKDNK